jgi:hypothetical protein
VTFSVYAGCCEHIMFNAGPCWLLRALEGYQLRCGKAARGADISHFCVAWPVLLCQFLRYKEFKRGRSIFPSLIAAMASLALCFLSLLAAAAPALAATSKSKSAHDM